MLQNEQRFFLRVNLPTTALLHGTDGHHIIRLQILQQEHQRTGAGGVAVSIADVVCFGLRTSHLLAIDLHRDSWVGTG